MPKRTLTQAAGSGVVISSSFPRRRLIFTPTTPATRGRFARYRGTVARGYTRRSGFYGRFGDNGGGELKFHDVDLDDANVATAGTIVPTINIIPQGTTEIQRIGRKCTIRSIAWRYRVFLPEQDAVMTPASSDMIRVILYVDKQTNGATATVTGILRTADFQSFNNLVNTRRFQILLDKSIDMNYLTLASDGAGVVSQGGTQKDFTFFKKLNLPIEFDAATGALTEIRSNNLGVLLISSGAVCGFDSKIRLRFSDN